MPTTQAAARTRRLIALTFLTLCTASTTAAAQFEQFATIDDSPTAAATLANAPDLTARGNTTEAVRALQQLLDEEAQRLVEASDNDDNLYISVREAVHRLLLSQPALLDAYRERQTERARTVLDQTPTGFLEVEERYLLTPAGYEAVLRKAQWQLERGVPHQALRTLNQLQNHPDQTQPALAEAAAIAADIARVLPQAAQTARSLAEQAGTEPPAETPEAENQPNAAGPAVSTPQNIGALGENPQAPINELVPLGTRATTPQVRQAFDEAFAGDRDVARQLASRGFRTGSVTLPAIVGDDIVINDGLTLSAFDRFTLEPRWRFQTPGVRIALEERADAVMRSVVSRQNLAGLGTLTPYGPLIIAAMVGGEASIGLDTVQAIDARTGNPLWSRPIADIHPTLESGAAAGPLVISGDTVVVSIRRLLETRRLATLAVAGLDAATGRTKWVRSLGSASTFPRQTTLYTETASRVIEGVVYRVDQLGIGAAIEADTGRVVWVRRLPSEGIRRGEEIPTYALGQLITRNTPQGTRLLALSPDRAEIIEIDPDNGDVLERTPSERYMEPIYLIQANARGRDMLVAVMEDRIAFEPLDNLGGDELSGAVFRTNVRGRVVPAGDRLLVPIGTRLAEVELTQRPDQRLIAVDNTGNIVAAPGQLVIVDELDAQSFLAWDVAADMLSERVEQSQDALPAVRFLQLAARAARLERLEWAADAAIDRLPASDEATRAQLFQTLADIIRAGQRRIDGAGNEQAVNDPALLARLVGRLERVANAPSETVTQRLALGWVRERTGQHAQAVEVYQSVLTDPALAEAIWTSGEATTRADAEAARRVRRLVEREGPAVYEQPAQRAQARLEELNARAQQNDTPEAELYRDAARAYPAAQAAPALWLAAARQEAQNNRRYAAARSLEAGLDSAVFLTGAGIDPPPEVIGELAGRLVTALAEMQRFDEAGRVANLIESTFGDTDDPFAPPPVALTVAGEPLDAAALLNQLAQRAAQRRALPRIGTQFAGPAYRLGGRVLEPVKRGPAERPTNLTLLYNTRNAQIQLIHTDAATGQHQTRWTQSANAEPLLISIDGGGILLAEPGAEGQTLRKLDLEDGSTLWNTPPFSKLAAQLPAPAQRDGRLMVAGNADFQTAADGAVSRNQILITATPRTIVLVERTGRAVALDVQTGNQLWARQLSVNIVNDAAADAGLLAVGGYIADNPETRFNPSRLGDPPGVHALAAYDIRTAEPLTQSPALSTTVGWVRVLNGSEIAAGLQDAIVGLSVTRPQLGWTVESEAAARTIDAWSIEGRLFVLNDTRQLREVVNNAGEINLRNLQQRGRLQVGSQIRAFAVNPASGRIAFTAPDGVLVYDQQGELVGANAEQPAVPALAAAAGAGVIVEISGTGTRNEDLLNFELATRDAASARKLAAVRVPLPGLPEQLTLADGVAFIVVGVDTLAIPLPVSAADAEPQQNQPEQS